MTQIAFRLLLFVSALQTHQNFINVDGPDLTSRAASAISRGAAQGGNFWLAYTFAVRPGVLFDTVVIGPGGSRMSIDGRAFATAPLETRNLGVFLLYDGATRRAIRAEVYNLDRSRDYFGYPVYWLGRASTDESLPFLRNLLNAMQSYESSRRVVDAIGAHDDPQAAKMLQDIVRSVRIERVRTAAVSWLGHASGQTDFLADLVRDERESAPVRREAAEALGEGAASSSLLQNLYRSVTHREVKAELLEAMGDRFDNAAVSFLIETFHREPDRHLREEAIEALAEINDDRAVDAMAKAYDSARDEQMKNEIIEALGDAESPRALEKLIAVAKTDPSVKLRRRAIAMLGESHDPAALEFLERLLK